MRTHLTRATTLAASTLVLFLATTAHAQATKPPKDAPPPPPTTGAPPRPPRGDGLPRAPEGDAPPRAPQGDGPPDATPFIDRLMGGDADGDGKLSKSELPPQIAERMFDRADTNHDGLLDRPELVAFAKTQIAEGRGGGPGGLGGGRGQQPNFGNGMRAAGRALRALGESSFDDASKKQDLELVTALEGGLVAAKAGYMTVPMSDKAKAKYGTNDETYRTDLRRQVFAALTDAIALEKAILDGHEKDAKALVEKITKDRDAGHEIFQPDEDRPPAPLGAEKREGPSAPRGGDTDRPRRPKQE